MPNYSLENIISMLISEHTTAIVEPDSLVVRLIKKIIVDRIGKYKSEIIFEGEPDPLIDAFIDGSVAGYNEAITQLIDHINDGCF